MAPNNNEDMKDKRSKWRLSNILSKDHCPAQKHDEKHDDTARQSTETQESSAHGDPKPNHSTAGNHPMPNTLQTDSAYGSTANTSSNASTEGVPSITEQQASVQRAPTKTHKDAATGKTITTTTTTTTTTVTTTNGDHIQLPPGQQVVVRKEEEIHPSSNGPSELSANSDSRGEQHRQSTAAFPEPAQPNAAGYRPQDSSRMSNVSEGVISPVDGPPQPMYPNSNKMNFSYPSRSPVPAALTPGSQPTSRYYASGESHPPQPQQPQPQPQQQPQGYPPPRSQQGRFPAYSPIPGAPQSQYQQPQVPSPHQGPMQHRPQPPTNISASHLPPRDSVASTGSPGPPLHHVQSHPSSISPQQLRERHSSQMDQRPQSTLANLKTAAVGLHGLTDTLRGTLNSEIDRRTGGPAASIAENKQIAERGRRELEAARMQAARERELRQRLETEKEQKQHSDIAQAQQQQLQYEAEITGGTGNGAKKGGFRRVLKKSREGLRT